MTRRDDHRIADIVDACQELSALTDMRAKADIPAWVLTRAAERLLEIVGEAASALSEAHQGRYAEVPWRDITRLRILLAHHYQRVDPDQVWAIAEQEIPSLAASLQRPGEAPTP
jgi:uncharacterized protein with HEPN domain